MINAAAKTVVLAAAIVTITITFIVKPIQQVEAASSSLGKDLMKSAAKSAAGGLAELGVSWVFITTKKTKILKKFVMEFRVVGTRLRLWCYASL